MTDTPAGWHPDPEQPGQLRYWDGTSVDRAPLAGPGSRAAAPGSPAPLGQQTVPTPRRKSGGGYAPRAGWVRHPASSSCLKVAIIVIVIFLVIGAVSVVGLVIGHKVATISKHDLGTARQCRLHGRGSSCRSRRRRRFHRWHARRTRPARPGLVPRRNGRNGPARSEQLVHPHRRQDPRRSPRSTHMRRSTGTSPGTGATARRTDLRGRHLRVRLRRLLAPLSADTQRDRQLAPRQRVGLKCGPTRRGRRRPAVARSDAWRTRCARRRCGATSRAGSPPAAASGRPAAPHDPRW